VDMEKKKNLTLFVFTFTVITLFLTNVTDARQSYLWVGDKVRIEAPNITGKPITGVVTHLTENEIIILSRGLDYNFPFSGIQRLDVSRGWHRNQWNGLLMGASAGIVLLGIIGAIGHNVCIQTIYTDCISKPKHWLSRFYVGPLAGFSLGGLAGVLIGSFVITDNWVHFSLKPETENYSLQSFNTSMKPGITINLKL